MVNRCVWLLLVCAALLTSCGGNPCEAGNPKFPGGPVGCQLETAAGPEDGAIVRMEVTGTGPTVDIFYGLGASGGTQFAVPLPWVFSGRAASGSSLYVSAWTSAAAANVAVKIVVDGKAVAEDAASGANANARATATCC